MAVVFETVVADDVDVPALDVTKLFVCEAAEVSGPAMVVGSIVGKLVVIWAVVVKSFIEVLVDVTSVVA